MIITIICITILAHLITGKDVKPLVEKLKNVRWPWRASHSFKYIRHYAIVMEHSTRNRSCSH